METPQKRQFSSPVSTRQSNQRSAVVREAASPPPSGGVRKHPMIVLTGLWLILLALGWLSMSEIISPGMDAPMPRTPIAQAERDQNASFGVLGAIAGSCAVLSLLLSHKMDRR